MIRFSSLMLTITVCLIIPLIYSSISTDPTTLPRIIILSLCLLTVIVILIVNHFGKTKLSDSAGLFLNPLFIVFLFYIIFSAFSILNSHNLAESIFEIAKLLLVFHLIIVLSIILTEDKFTYHIIPWSVVVTAIILGIGGIIQYQTNLLDFLPGTYKPYVTMQHNNLFGSFMFLTLPFVLYTLIAPKHRNQLPRNDMKRLSEEDGTVKHSLIPWKLLSTFALLLISYNVVIAGARAVWLAIIIASSLTLFLLWRNSKLEWIATYKFSFKRGHVVLIALSVSIIIVISAITSDIQVGVTDNLRLKIWQKTKDMIVDHPISGVGIGNWKLVYPSYGVENLPEHFQIGHKYILRPHNDFLLVIAEIGVFGSLLYFSFFALLIHYTVRTIKHTTDTNTGIMSALLFFGVIGYMTISFFSFPRERIAHSIMFCLMASFVVSIRHSENKPLENQSAKIVPIYLVTALPQIFLCGYIGISRFTSESHLRDALIARADSNWNSVVTEIDHAITPIYNVDFTTAPLKWYRGVANFALNNYQAALIDFKEAAQNNPNHLHVLNNLAGCYEYLNDHSNAVEYYQKALAISPDYEEILLNLAAVYFNNAMYEEALGVLKRCKPKTNNPRYTLYMNKLKDQLRIPD